MNTEDAEKDSLGEGGPRPAPGVPRCPKCGFVMCEQFDTQRINDHADLVTPNGTYICYGCTLSGERSTSD